MLFDKLHRGRPAAHSDPMRNTEDAEFLEDADVSVLAWAFTSERTLFRTVGQKLLGRKQSRLGSTSKLHLPAWTEVDKEREITMEKENGKAVAGR